MPKQTASAEAELPAAFASRKATILQALAQAPGDYQDASPKGSVDKEIRDLIDEINAHPACVTTSSCAGRIAVFLEAKPRTPATLASRGQRHDGPSHGGSLLADERPSELQQPGPLGRVSQESPDSDSIKGVGGRWLYVSHAPVDLDALRRGELLHAPARTLQQLFGLHGAAPPTAGGLEPSPSPSLRPRYVHFKFEPMILHILTASLATAQATLTAAQQAGFRESGVSNVTSPTPMVAVRSQGLALDSLVGVLAAASTPDVEIARSLVAEDHLCTLVTVAHARFAQNSQRVSRFRALLHQHLNPLPAQHPGARWEEPGARRARMRAEGLRKQQERRSADAPTSPQQEYPDLDSGTEDMGLQV